MIRSRRSRIVALAVVLAVGTVTAVPAQAAPRQTIDVSNGNPCFVQAAYLNLLGRYPTFEERGRWIDQLEAGTDRGTIAIGLAHTKEWARQVVIDLYLDILDRTPDTAGLESWATRLAGGTRTAEVGTSLYGSAEFFTKSGGTAPTYVDAVYENLLGRAPDANGRAYWIDRLESGGKRELVARQFFLSLESNGNRVDTLYRHLLGRDSDPGGRAYWAERLVLEDDLILAGLLVGSNEFYEGHAQCLIDPDVPTGVDPTLPSADVTATYILNLVNSTRRTDGTGDSAKALTSDNNLRVRTQRWAETQARNASLNQPAIADVLGPNPGECPTIESIVKITTSQSMTKALLLTATYKAMMIDPEWDRMAVGVAHVSSFAYVAVVFVDDGPCPADN